MPARIVSAKPIITVMIVSAEASVVASAIPIVISIDHDRSGIVARRAINRRRGTIYRRIIHRPLVANRASDPDIQTHLSPGITAAARKYERGNNYFLHLILLSGITGLFRELRILNRSVFAPNRPRKFHFHGEHITRSEGGLQENTPDPRVRRGDSGVLGRWREKGFSFVTLILYFHDKHTYI